jgi:flagellar biosynthesis/type III secretory pathway M-ring protein FliF/YscJ
MTDVLAVAIIVVFFVAAAALVPALNRVISDSAEADEAETETADSSVEEQPRAADSDPSRQWRS